MTNCPTDIMIAAYALQDKLPQEIAKEIKEHLKTCWKCLDEVITIREADYEAKQEEKTTTYVVKGSWSISRPIGEDEIICITKNKEIADKTMEKEAENYTTIWIDRVLSK